MFRIFCCVLLTTAPATIGRAAIYQPVSTVLEAASGRTSNEGGTDRQDLGPALGYHSAHSTYTYLSGWSGNYITCSATASSDLGDAQIAISVATTTNGFSYDRTAGYADATVEFHIPSGYSLMLDGTSYGSSTSGWSLTGPSGWSWTDPLGSTVPVEPGRYRLWAHAHIVRTAGVDSRGSVSLALTVIPEPSAATLLTLAAASLLRRRMRK